MQWFDLGAKTLKALFLDLEKAYEEKNNHAINDSNWFTINL